MSCEYRTPRHRHHRLFPRLTERHITAVAGGGQTLGTEVTGSTPRYTLRFHWKVWLLDWTSRAKTVHLHLRTLLLPDLPGDLSATELHAILQVNPGICEEVRLLPRVRSRSLCAREHCGRETVKGLLTRVPPPPELQLLKRGQTELVAAAREPTPGALSRLLTSRR